MSDILHEVDDLMRQERLMNIWRRHGNTVIGGILALVLGVALSQGYHAWTKAKAEKNTAVLMAAWDNGAELEKFANDRGGNAGVLARIMAAEKLSADKKTQAAALYLAARNEARADKDLRDLATLLWVRAVSAEDNVKPADLRAALDPLMRDGTQPFAGPARIEAALIAAERQNDLAGAIKLLEPLLSDRTLPFTQSERARALTQVYRLRLEQAGGQ